MEYLDGKNDEAVKYYEQVISILNEKENKEDYKDTYISIYNNLARIAFDKGDMEAAKGYYNKWLEFDPENEALRKYVETLK